MDQKSRPGLDKSLIEAVWQGGRGQGSEVTSHLPPPAGVCLRPFRTGTALCVPDPVFSHSESHALLAPLGVPVQRLLLSSCSSQGPSARGGIPFQVWCR